MTSWTEIPHFAVSRNIEAVGIRAALANAKSINAAATFTDVLISVTVKALGALPELTAHDIGLAVAGPYGVTIAVLDDIDQGDIASIVAKRRNAVSRVREGKASQADMTVYPDLTLSNMGGLGVDAFTGIVPPGQKMLVTTGRLNHVLAADGVGSTPVISVTCVADHRALDGADLANFLQRLQVASNESSETEFE